MKEQMTFHLTCTHLVSLTFPYLFSFHHAFDIVLSSIAKSFSVLSLFSSINLKIPIISVIFHQLNHNHLFHSCCQNILLYNHSCNFQHDPHMCRHFDKVQEHNHWCLKIRTRLFRKIYLKLAWSHIDNFSGLRIFYLYSS